MYVILKVFVPLEPEFLWNLNFCYAEKEFTLSMQCLNYFLTEYSKMSRCSSIFSDPVAAGVTPSSEQCDSSLTGSRTWHLCFCKC